MQEAVASDAVPKLYGGDAGHLILNVGGTKFETTRQTLLSEPDSFLAGLARHTALDCTCTPEIFVDRDPQFFRPILNYLRQNRRDGVLQVDVHALGFSEKLLLADDIEFYQLRSLDSLRTIKVGLWARERDLSDYHDEGFEELIELKFFVICEASSLDVYPPPYSCAVEWRVREVADGDWPASDSEDRWSDSRGGCDYPIQGGMAHRMVAPQSGHVNVFPGEYRVVHLQIPAGYIGNFAIEIVDVQSSRLVHLNERVLIGALI